MNILGEHEHLFKHKANRINYDNTTSGLTATDVQSALDELEGLISDENLWDRDGVNGYLYQHTLTDKVLIGTNSQAANDGVLNVNGIPGDSGTPTHSGLSLRSGNAASLYAGSEQVTFAFGGLNQYRHNIRTTHNGGAATNNAWRLFLWNQAVDSPDDPGSLLTATFEATHGGSLGLGGIINPTETLDVNGNAKIASTYHFKIGSDNALYFPVSNTNIAVGAYAGNDTISGINDTLLGGGSGYNITSGSNNTIVGAHPTLAWSPFTTGLRNTVVGATAADGSTGGINGNDNVIIGYGAGSFGTTSVSGSVLIGTNAGAGLSLGSNQLWIDNSNTTTPLIYGEFDNDLIRVNGEFQLDTKYQIKNAENLDIDSAAPEVVDEVLVDSYCAVFWDYLLVDDDGYKEAGTIIAIHDGTTSADAVNCNQDKWQVIPTPNIPSVSLSVDLNGTGATQTMRLIATATQNDCKVKVTRRAISVIN